MDDAVGVVARVGKDFPVGKILTLKANTAGLRVVPNALTAKFYHTYLSIDGQDRTFKPVVTDETLITPEDIPFEYFESQYIHISTNYPKTQIACIKRIRQNSNALISIDTHEAYLAESRNEVFQAFSMVDIAFIDRHENELIVECKAPVKIIKRGKEGIAYMSNKLQLEIPTDPCDVVDKTGAGDVLAGIFLTLRACGATVEEAGEKAVEVASASVRDYGVEFLGKLYGDRL